MLRLRLKEHVFCLMQALAPGSETKLDAETLEAVAGSAPLVELPAEQVLGRQLIEVMAAIQMQDSKSAARRLIKVVHPLSCFAVTAPVLCAYI